MVIAVITWVIILHTVAPTAFFSAPLPAPNEALCSPHREVLPTARRRHRRQALPHFCTPKEHDAVQRSSSSIPTGAAVPFTWENLPSLRNGISWTGPLNLPETRVQVEVHLQQTCADGIHRKMPALCKRRCTYVSPELVRAFLHVQSWLTHRLSS